MSEVIHCTIDKKEYLNENYRSCDDIEIKAKFERNEKIKVFDKKQSKSSKQTDTIDFDTIKAISFASQTNGSSLQFLNKTFQNIEVIEILNERNKEIDLDGLKNKFPKLKILILNNVKIEKLVSRFSHLSKLKVLILKNPYSDNNNIALSSTQKPPEKNIAVDIAIAVNESITKINEAIDLINGRYWKSDHIEELTNKLNDIIDNSQKSCNESSNEKINDENHEQIVNKIAELNSLSTSSWSPFWIGVALTTLTLFIFMLLKESLWKKYYLKEYSIADSNNYSNVNNANSML